MSTSLKQCLAGLLAGTVFGAGIAVSGLSDPNEVLRFLTISSGWSPALLFTMGAAIAVSWVGYRWVLQRGPVFAERLQLPSKTTIDWQLLLGAALFGIGWGIAGFCPGPAIVGLAAANPEPYVFVIAFLVGSQLQRLVTRQ